MKNKAIFAENVSKTFKDVQAVKGLDFQVNTAECFGFLGPNGAGKTTLMQILIGRCRRDTPDKSIVEIFGFDPEIQELEIKYLSGVVPQEDNLDVDLSVRQNLLIYTRFYGIKKRDAQERIDELLDFMDLSEKKDSKIRELSGGMKRRLIIARALINSPRLLILDEPTTGLDPQVRQHIWDKLRQLQKDGVTILLTTHYMEEAFQICNRLIIMHKGEKILQGSPKNLIWENMESYVLEILNPDLVTGVKLSGDIRKEETETRVFLYSENFASLDNIAGSMKPGSFFLRQANLEDLFLRTTGRKLHE